MSASNETRTADPGQRDGSTGSDDAPDPYAAYRESGISPLPVSALQVETSSICNFRCPSCPLSLKEYDRPEKHMGPEEFRKVLDAFPDVKKVELQGVGEVFLNDRVFEIVREATDRGVAVHTFSNASVIDRATARKIVESGLQLINFSLDGSDEPTFRTLRKGGTLKRFKRSLRNLQLAKALAGSEFPTVNLMVVLQRDNKHQAPQMVAIAEELGAQTVIFTKINAGTRSGLEPKLLTEEDRAAFEALPPYRGKVEIVWAITPWTHAERVACYWPKEMTYVTVEGHVTPCCNYYDDREMHLGNVFEQTGEDIWNGEAYRAFRKRLWSGDLPSKCQTC